MKAKEWTNEELELLKAIYATDSTFKDIITELPGRSPNSIRLMASRLGLKRPTLLEKIHPVNSIAISEGNRIRGYLIRCSECKSWIHVDEIVANGTVYCEHCGAVCYLAI